MSLTIASYTVIIMKCSFDSAGCTYQKGDSGRYQVFLIRASVYSPLYTKELLTQWCILYDSLLCFCSQRSGHDLIGLLDYHYRIMI